MKPAKVRRRLESALVEGRITTVWRDAFEIASTDGLVVALTDDWVVLHDLADGVHLDGLVALRLRDVSRVLFRDDDAYHRRALAALGVEVATYEVEADVDARGLLARAQAEDRLVAIHLEVLRGEPMTLGRLLDLRRKRFVIHYIGRDGEWAREPERWRYRDVTRIEVGGRYLEALERFGDPFPTD
ncbi:hypothetical protein [Nocardioides zeae]|uniref:Uncharacterized protein n=1 Tax=Nocardioides zeae TaxID=1457234 RepID=A0AAJ1U2H5_9ACTN|nr:hypothetical protein [Nocardioides zeae]MDQ1104745.1 hypothetical protein [Nocardioides zeae]